MKDFFGKYTYSTVKMFINQFAISIFGSVLSLATSAAQNRLLSMAVSGFAVAFYLFLIYTMTWEIGAKDRIRIDSGKAGKFTLKGALLASVANIVNLFLAIFVIVFESIHVFAGTEAFNGVITVLIVVIRFTSAMFLRSVNAICLPFDEPYVLLAQSAGYLVFFILTIGVCQLAYTLGMNNFKIFGNKQKNH